MLLFCNINCQNLQRERVIKECIYLCTYLYTCPLLVASVKEMYTLLVSVLVVAAVDGCTLQAELDVH